MSGFLAGLAKGGAEGLANGIGSMAKDLRAAITGKQVLSPEDIYKVQELAQRMEIAALEADKAVLQGQVELNKIDAEKGGLFRAGWRPFLGWVCGLAFAYQFLFRPVAPWLFDVLGFQAQVLPEVELGTMMPLLFGMLGLGGMRTFEKVKGLK